MCAHFREIYSGFTGLYCKSKGILFDFQGPNWLWSVDGHEKVAQPLGGLYIYGAIDTFSRKLMALTVLPNKKAATVASWLVPVLQHYGCKYGNKELKTFWLNCHLFISTEKTAVVPFWGRVDNWHVKIIEKELLINRSNQLLGGMKWLDMNS